MRKLLLLAAAAVQLAASEAAAREVDWTAETLTDVAFGLGTILVNEYGPSHAHYTGDEFPTQHADDEAHRALHGEPTAPETTAKERRYREASNVAVAAASLMPVYMAYVRPDGKAAGRIMTTFHAMLAGGFVNAWIKHEVGRPRPKARQDPDTVARHDDAASFPSGHAQTAFTGATLVSCFFPDSPLWVRASAFGLATATSLFRIQGDKHFLTDVTVGGVLGVGAGLVADAVYEGEARGLSLRPGPSSIALVYRY